MKRLSSNNCLLNISQSLAGEDVGVSVGQLWGRLRLSLQERGADDELQMLARLEGLYQRQSIALPLAMGLLLHFTTTEWDLLDVLPLVVGLVNSAGLLRVLFQTDISHPVVVSAEVGQALLAMVDILLGNILQHAGTDRAEMLLELENSTLRLMVNDNGAGFSVSEAQERHARGGLHTLHEIAQDCGGSVRMYSNPGFGTRVHLLIPLGGGAAAGLAMQDMSLAQGGILLINESTIFLRGLSSLLTANGFQVMASVSDPALALEAAQRLEPGVILLDVLINDEPSFGLARSLRDRLPEAKIVFLTESGRLTNLRDAINSGASAYLHRNMPFSDLMAALKSLDTEPFMISPVFANRMVLEQAGEKTVLEKLTPFQLVIYDMVQQRLTNREIAERLNLSESGVKYHVRQIILHLSAQKKSDLFRA